MFDIFWGKTSRRLSGFCFGLALQGIVFPANGEASATRQGKAASCAWLGTFVVSEEENLRKEEEGIQWYQ